MRSNSITSFSPRFMWVAFLCLFIARPEAGAAVKTSKESIDFNRDIRPILAENCLTCHGPDKGKRKAGLRLDDPQSATSVLESGAKAIVPGNPEASLILKVVSTESEEDRMPPPKTGKRLKKEQIEQLRRWIAGGAAFKPHWAYLTPERPELPPVKAGGWVKNEIDRFILSRLEKEGLKPSAEADKPTLIRRVTLDLTGLPPTLSEVQSFVEDRSSNAYEKVVDRLLGSQAFGERMAQQWLDLARYADSDGYHADAPRSMWQYRDYVIRSFNENKPFNQFTLEQLAGDLLPQATLDQRIATAFNRNGMSSTEGGADPDEYMNKYVTDRVNTFGTVFLGSSTACTECHDHKYDPFTQREYYQLYDFFNRIPERGLDSDPAPPFVKIPTSEQTATLTRLTNEVAQLERQREAWLQRTDEAFTRDEATWAAQHRSALQSGWQSKKTTSASASSGAQLKTLEDGSILVSGTESDKDTYQITLEPFDGEVHALRLEAIPHPDLPSGNAGRGAQGTFFLSRLEVEAESANPAAEPTTPSTNWNAWSALGPFKAGNAAEVFEKAFVKESESEPARIFDGESPKWRTVPDWKEEASLPLSGENQVTYLHRTVRVATGRYLKLSLGSDGGMQLWVNGEKVEKGRIIRHVAPAPEDVLVWLHPGENHLLLKVHHGSGVYGVRFTPSKEPVVRHPVEFATAFADSNAKDRPASAALDDKPDSGWKLEDGASSAKESHQAVFLTRRPITFAGGTRLKVKLSFAGPTPHESLGHFRLTAGPGAGLDAFANLPPAVQTALFRPDSSLTPEQRRELTRFRRETAQPELKGLVEKLAETRKAAKDLDGRIPTLRVMEDMPEPRVTQIRVRGDYRNRGEKVVAGVPKILPPLPSGVPTNRLTLAQWLTDPKHPLLGRVTVNRYWSLYFGNGLVKTGNEFGTQGELPSHPELLDWLAREFVDGGWNIKAMQKKIVMSATYRQNSRPTPELLEKDPLNRLLARGPRHRLSAEVIRDCALDYAGLLDRKRPPGGPSVKPYQPAGLWEEKMFGGNKYEESKGADLYRRSLYTLWKRTVLNPTLMTFDAPDRAICTEQRSVTCTPLQAFITLNEKGFVEAARVFAERILREGGTDLQQRITYAYQTVLARPPTSKERQIIAGIHADMFQTYQNDLKGAIELLSTGEAARAEKLNQLDLVAWTGVANVMLNLDEAISNQ